MQYEGLPFCLFPKEKSVSCTHSLNSSEVTCYYVPCASEHNDHPFVGDRDIKAAMETKALNSTLPTIHLTLLPFLLSLLTNSKFTLHVHPTPYSSVCSLLEEDHFKRITGGLTNQIATL